MLGPPPWAAVHPALRLVRLNNVLVSFAGTVVGGLVARGAGLDLPLWVYGTLALAAASSAMVTAGGNVLNDVLDVEGDRVNHPDRPLVTGAIRLVSARRGAIALLVASLAAILPILWFAPWVGVIWVVAVGALLTYEFRFKALGLAGNLLVAFLTAAVFLYGGAAAGAPVLLIPFALMAFGATLSREVIKDMEDAAGDTDRRTLPRVQGFGTAALVARGAVAVAIGLSPIPLLSFLRLSSAAGIIYLGLVLVADGLFVYSVARLPKELHREQTVSKGAMTVALLAFLAAAFR
jgi:geranylgeranylglycerol-phosphate geranylgeranyltransferase